MRTTTRVQLLVLSVVLAASVRTGAAATIKVMPTNPAGWTIANFDDDTAALTAPPGTPTTSGTDSDFVTGPGSPPIGPGSLHEVVGTNGMDQTRISTSALNGTLLSALTDVSYSTYVTASTDPGQAVFLVLLVDLDGDGTPNDILFFEPVYQTGTYTMTAYSPDPVPDQCGANPVCVTTGVWQTWDADAGGWYTDTSGPPLTTLANYAANFPGAKLATTTDAVRLVAGIPAPGAWNGFDGNVDNLTIGGNTYDFDVCTDGPLYVDDTGTDTGNDCTVAATPCLTVQRAVDVACPGATINVAAGTYPEQVTIAKSVQVIGAGKDLTTIQAPATLPGLGNILTVTGVATNAEIAALTVAGPGPGTCDSIGAGIFVGGGAVANIHDNAIVDIRDEPLDDCAGVGIQVGNVGPDTTASATITDNVLTGYQRTGILVAATGSSATIDGNTVTGGGNLNHAQQGIRVIVGASAQISGNTVSDHRCDGVDCESFGIEHGGTIPSSSISDNDVQENDNGIDLFLTGAGSIPVTNNLVDGSRIRGIAVGQGTAAVTGNTITGNTSIGLLVWTSAAATADTVATLSCNAIEGNGVGIQLSDSAPMDAFAPLVSGSDNAISGNTTGASNSSAVTPDLEDNYWGSNTGPNPPGSGDTIVGSIDADPFLLALPPCLGCANDADCTDGLVCNGDETCVAGVCQSGSAVVCMPAQCEASSACQEPGTCVPTPKPDDVVCNDGQACTVGDSCQAGICTSGAGGDADGDGDCDDEEAACGCDAGDGRYVCALPNRIVGRPGSSTGEVLINWHTPTDQRVTVATDPSCQASGVCTAGRCTAGRVNDLCAANADCNLPADTCRVIVNYADTPGLTLDFARVGRTDVTPLFQLADAGCSLKVDVPLDSSRATNRLRLRAEGSIDGRVWRDRDTIIYR